MRSAILLGSFFIGNSLVHISHQAVGLIAGILLFALMWDALETINNWRA